MSKRVFESGAQKRKKKLLLQKNNEKCAHSMLLWITKDTQGKSFITHCIFHCIDIPKHYLHFNLKSDR